MTLEVCTFSDRFKVCYNLHHNTNDPQVCNDIYVGQYTELQSSDYLLSDYSIYIKLAVAFTTLTLLVGYQEGHLACKKSHFSNIERAP